MTQGFTFELEAEDGATAARAGVLRTPHGEVRTPVFMPVGTLGTVKALSVDDLTEAGAGIILGNTYHLYLRPGLDVIEAHGGLHGFCNWRGPILTDSGGFQIFSLATLKRMSEEGATFQSHIDGSSHFLSPEKAVRIQMVLGSDISMCLDECIAFPADEARAEKALELTTRWAARCREEFTTTARPGQALFGIVQGGMYPALRERSARELMDIGFDGYALGGLSVGEPRDLMMEIAGAALPRLPRDRARYVMGVGKPEDLVDMVALGADMFDCVLPTRNARNGQLFTDSGVLNMANAKHRYDTGPVDENCTCYTCVNHSRSYLRHLYMSRELLAYRLNTLHNVHYFVNLMRRARQAVLAGDFARFREKFFARRRTAGE
ncbi:MAG: tRNA guanosine(34) transglycosylase Tgt [Desulfatibacillaceae bacterium]